MKELKDKIIFSNDISYIHFMYHNFKVMDCAVSNDFLNSLKELEFMLEKNLNVFRLTVNIL